MTVEASVNFSRFGMQVPGKNNQNLNDGELLWYMVEAAPEAGDLTALPAASDLAEKMSAEAFADARELERNAAAIRKPLGNGR